jgi:hypothetical protein
MTGAGCVAPGEDWPRDRVAVPQGMGLPAEVTDQDKEGEGGGKEGAIGHDGGLTQ